MISSTIYFVRHGHVHNPLQVYYGRLAGYRLSDTGREQAQAVARYLARRPVSVLYSSPMLRARQTAEIIQDGLPGRDVVISEYLNEVYTPFDGDALAECEARGWDIYTGTQAPYEQPDDVLVRMQAFLRMVCQEHAGEQIVAVTHADPIVFCALWAHGAPITLENRRAPESFGLPPSFPMPASVAALTVENGGDQAPNLVYFEV